MKTTFSSIVGPTFRSYLALKRALGRQYAMVERVLVHLDQFLTARSADLSAETFAAWCLTFQHLASGNRRNRMREVRNVCLYRRRREPSCFVPDERLFPPVHQPIRPHIFTDGEVGQLLAAARTRAHTDNSPLCPETMRLAIVLLYTTGMRRRALTRLTVGDYNTREHTLMIRESKFHKSRLIPVSGDAGREIDRLLETRRQQQYPTGGGKPLLLPRYRRHNGGGPRTPARAPFRPPLIPPATGQLPRPHDFRHAFAVTVLLRWYRQGLDPAARLHQLSTFLGHVNPDT